MKKTLRVSKSVVMKKAWELFKMSQKWVDKLSFSECLKRAWATEKRNAVEYVGQVGLYINGAYCTAMIATGYVEGNTFKAREILKKFGLGWNGYEKVWEGTQKQMQELCRAYA
ncbi:hypothetical protein HNQ56_003718 [Anaerotaenia torta]|uniref:hypothetical protein n=1 Tax=Anaerotaenia torta TaxID=433293 RepID=UPI003D1E8036